MIKTEKFPNAYKEVYEILKYMDKKDVELIHNNFMEMLKHNMNNDYKFEIDENKDFEEQNLLKETKVLLAYIYMNYWGMENEKEIIRKKFQQDIIRAEEAKPKYNPDELFKDAKIKNTVLNEQQDENNSLIEYKQQGIFSKIINKIKSILKIHKND